MLLDCIKNHTKMHLDKLTNNFRRLANFKNEAEKFDMIDQNAESDDVQCQIDINGYFDPTVFDSDSENEFFS